MSKLLNSRFIGERTMAWDDDAHVGVQHEGANSKSAVQRPFPFEDKPVVPGPSSDVLGTLTEQICLINN